MPALLRNLVGFATAVLVALAVSRLWQRWDWPGRLVAVYSVAAVVAGVVVHALTPPPRREWRVRLRELTVTALLSGLVFAWLEHTWP